MKYLEILNKDKETLAKENNELENEKAENNIRSLATKLKEAISENKKLVIKITNTVPLNFDSLYEAEVEGKVLAKRLEWLEAKKKELF